LIGLAMSVEIQDDGDLAALLTEERRGPKQPVLESLLDAATADSEASIDLQIDRAPLGVPEPWRTRRRTRDYTLTCCPATRSCGGSGSRRIDGGACASRMAG
jgi:hypothetical protein